MPTNDFLPFAINSTANVMSQADYAALAARVSGFSSGTARSEQLNKAWRQSSVIAAVLAQFIANNSGNDVLDDGDVDAILADLQLAIEAVAAVAAGAPPATEAVAGIIRIATDAEVNAGASDNTAITPLKLKNKTQASLLDATADRLMQVGAFGIGAASALISNTDLNDLDTTGFYFGEQLVGAPDVGWHHVISLIHNDSYRLQILSPFHGTGLYYRSQENGTWEIQRVWDTANFDPAAYQPLLGYVPQPTLGFTPVQQGTGVGQTPSALKLGWDGGNAIRATVDATDLGQLWMDGMGGEKVRVSIASFGAGEAGTYGLFITKGGGGTSVGTVVAGADLGWSNTA
ncbi:hypothetical protein ACIQVE_07000, partial [Pseudomonas sp. NPDC098747]